MSGLADALIVPEVTQPTQIEDAELVRELQNRGYIVHQDEPNLHRALRLDSPKRGKVRIAVATDTHLCNKHQQISAWRDFYERAAREWNCDFGLHAGDLVDGENMHRDQVYELFVHGADAQADYAVNTMPELKNRRGKTLQVYGIGGNHDGSHWNTGGTNVLSRVAAKRDDYTYLGAPYASFYVSGLRIDLAHPDGGATKTRSYKQQTIVEQMPPDDKPHVLLIGHYHVTNHLPGYRNVESFMLPCFESQTAYLRRKVLSPVIGGVLLELEFSERGLEDITTKWCIYRTPVDRDWP